MEQPTLLALPAGLALFGSPSFVWQDSTVFASIDSAGHRPDAGNFALAGLLFDSALTPHPIPLPPGVARMLAPRVIPGPRGVADVFWGAAADTATGPEPNATALWHAVFDGRAWSAPEQIFRAAFIGWTVTGPTVVGGGGPTIAVPASDQIGGVDHDGVAIIRRSGGAWPVSWIDVHSATPNTTAVAALGGGRLLLVFVGSLWSSALRVTNAVFAARSSDDGATWTAPTVLLSYGSRMVNELQLVTMPSADLHLFWLRRVSPSQIFGDSVQHAVSRDAGATWEFLPGVGGVPAVAGLTVAPLPDGAIAVAARSVMADSLLIAIWDAGAWRLPLHGALSAVHSSPRFIGRPAGAFWLAWGVARRGAVPQFPSAMVPELRLASLQRWCGVDAAPHDSLP
ncbi:MAG: sialidase family protein [Gemmatimonadaceae bacterium]